MIRLKLLPFVTSNELMNLGIHYQQYIRNRDGHYVPPTERTQYNLLSTFVQKEKLNLYLSIL